uniref:Uncharacterized protein n=1 Tax=Anopheles funestus TaxID=62324 RepID=A0A182S1Q2_ANOFN
MTRARDDSENRSVCRRKFRVAFRWRFLSFAKKETLPLPTQGPSAACRRLQGYGLAYFYREKVFRLHTAFMDGSRWKWSDPVIY